MARQNPWILVLWLPWRYAGDVYFDPYDYPSVHPAQNVRRRGFLRSKGSGPHDSAAPWNVNSAEYAGGYGCGLDFASRSNETFEFCDHECGFIVRSMTKGEVIYLDSRRPARRSWKTSGYSERLRGFGDLMIRTPL